MVWPNKWGDLFPVSSLSTRSHRPWKGRPFNGSGITAAMGLCWDRAKSRVGEHLAVEPQAIKKVRFGIEALLRYSATGADNRGRFFPSARRRMWSKLPLPAPVPPLRLRRSRTGTGPGALVNSGSVTPLLGDQEDGSQQGQDGTQDVKTRGAGAAGARELRAGRVAHGEGVIGRVF